MLFDVLNGSPHRLPFVFSTLSSALFCATETHTGYKTETENARRKTRNMNANSQKIVRSIETRKRYRVIREYRHVLLVTREGVKRALPFTVSRTQVEPVGAQR